MSRDSAQTLRSVLASGKMLVAPGVYDGISVTVANEFDYPCHYLPGHAIALSAVGVPDIGLVTMSEAVDRARLVARLSKRPVIADADTGFGNHLNVARAVEEFEAAGVAGIHLEDQMTPKRCGHLDQKAVVSAEEYVVTLRAALRARSSADFVIIARTDARGPLGLDEAIDRANRYRQEGADLVFVEAPRSLLEIESVASRVDAPLVFNVVSGGLTPHVSLSQLREWGYRLVLLPGLSSIAAVQGIEAALESIRDREVLPEAFGGQPPRVLFERFGLGEWQTRDWEAVQSRGLGKVKEEGESRP